MLLCAAAASIEAQPVRLRCEARTNPLGIDVAQPVLSWQSDSQQRNWRQSAFEIFVASSPEALASKRPDVWDSGKQRSSESAGVAYAGPKLASRKRYFWTVRVWDRHGHFSQAMETAWWEMGLLERADWSAKWIRWQNPEEAPDRAGIQWIWATETDQANLVPGAKAFFHLDFDLAEMPQRAALFLIAHGDWKVTVNGHDAGAKPHWNEFDRREIDGFLVQGKNSIDVTVSIPRAGHAAVQAVPRRPALAALLKIRHTDGTVERIPTGDRWQARTEADAPWAAANVIGKLDDEAVGPDPGRLPQPAGLLRHEFSIDKEVRSARAYVTALGAYELYINGRRVGPFVLTPGFTGFAQRLQYQVYDVTGFLTNGQNAAGAILGDGWFASAIAWTADHFKLLPPTRFLAQIEIEYTDGTRQNVVSDETWKAAESPILHSEIYAGETYDARLEQPGWNRTGFDDSKWADAVSADPYGGALSGQLDEPPGVVMTLKPEKVNALPGGSYVFDMGQNMVGWAALKVRGDAGTTVRLRFAEILNPDGSIYTTNLRNADATDTFTLRGGVEETFVPHFTFHGFRYVEVSGYPGAPTLDDLSAEVISSLHGEPTAIISTSSELVNKMWRIGIWGQRGNFLSVPTDCPQRDERLGWMGDAGVFWRTGSYNFDTQAFTHKWTRDVRDAQLPDGAFTNVSPNIGVDVPEGAPGWGDAGVIVPWTAWQQYADVSVIERNWDAMERWMKFIQDANPDFLRKHGVGPDFADWLAPDRRTLPELVDTAYWALIARKMSEMAHAVGKQDEARRFADVYANIRAAFQKAYVKNDGTVGTGTQTSYVVALYMKLLPPELEPLAVNHLVSDIEAHNWHLTTGFLGTPFLLFALSDHGRYDVAYRLLLTETYPSWGYMLAKGATTWWERWNGDTGDPAMNSYNHYAFGSVVAWIYQRVAGIDASPDTAGFHEIIIRPYPDAQLTQARAEYDSVYGKIISDWSGTPAGPFTLNVTIPANATAKVFLPEISRATITQNGKRVRFPKKNGERAIPIGSGSYRFEEK